MSPPGYRRLHCASCQREPSTGEGYWTAMEIPFALHQPVIICPQCLPGVKRAIATVIPIRTEYKEPEVTVYDDSDLPPITP